MTEPANPNKPGGEELQAGGGPGFGLSQPGELPTLSPLPANGDGGGGDASGSPPANHPPKRAKVNPADLLDTGTRQALEDGEADAPFLDIGGGDLGGLDLGGLGDGDDGGFGSLPERQGEEASPIKGPFADRGQGGPDDRVTLENVMRVLKMDPEKAVREGDEIRLFCPIHKDLIRRSLVVHAVRRDFCCQFKACPGRKGGNLIDLVAMALRIEPEAALSRLIGGTQELLAPLTGKVGEAQEFIDALDYEKALPLLKEALALNPKDETTRCRLASLQLEMGKRDEGIENYLVAAEHYAVGGHLAKTLQIYKMLVLVDPNDYNLHEQMAFISARLGDTQEAASRLKWLVDRFIEQGQHQEAVERVDRLLELTPGAADSIRLKAELLIQQGQGERASEFFAYEIQNSVKENDLESALRLANAGVELLPHNQLLQLLRQEVSGELAKMGLNAERLTAEFKALREPEPQEDEDDGFKAWIAELEDDIQHYEKAEERFHETGEISMQDDRVRLCKQQLSDFDSERMQKMYDHLREMYQDMKEAWEAGEVSDIEKKVIADFYRSFCVAFKEQNKDNTGDSMLTRF